MTKKLSNVHTFHIPVMGTVFSIDTPLRVAKYGISSVISIVDDVLIEQIRKLYCDKINERFEPVPASAEDARARRITLYLNLMNRLVDRQIAMLKAEAFTEDSDIVKYFEMLPDSPLRSKYLLMVNESDAAKKSAMQDELRSEILPGSIDVNIMTKIDRDIYSRGEKLPPEYAEAMSGLRGFAKSDLNSSVVLSAGMNPRLYTYLTQFDDFYPNESGELKKRVILKVSDFRSAKIQGKALAKKGIWISEYRIESGLNCGGHAFATKGYLLGQILEEFRENKQELIDSNFKQYNHAIEAKGYKPLDTPPPMLVTVQGGIGTAEEAKLMLEHYKVDSTGWGTPFLLVPEATNVDDEHLKKLIDAGDDDVYLSSCSPMGVPFWNLRTSLSESERKRRVREGKPGMICTKGFLMSNTEFTELPICTASIEYQQKKIEQIESQNISEEVVEILKEETYAKTCLCRDLAGSLTNSNATPAICCGPNIVNYSKVFTLKEMIDHIYGRGSVMSNPKRPHVFIKELMLYLDYYKSETHKFSLDISFRTPKYFEEFKENILSGISYYEERVDKVKADLKADFDEIRKCFE